MGLGPRHTRARAWADLYLELFEAERGDPGTEERAGRDTEPDTEERAGRDIEPSAEECAGQTDEGAVDGETRRQSALEE